MQVKKASHGQARIPENEKGNIIGLAVVGIEKERATKTTTTTKKERKVVCVRRENSAAKGEKGSRFVYVLFAFGMEKRSSFIVPMLTKSQPK